MDKGKKELKLSLQLRETAQQRCLMNYHNYLKSWDKYEKRVQRHFEYKELAKFESIKEYQKYLDGKKDKAKRVVSLYQSL